MSPLAKLSKTFGPFKINSRHMKINKIKIILNVGFKQNSWDRKKKKLFVKFKVEWWWKVVCEMNIQFRGDLHTEWERGFH